MVRNSSSYIFTNPNETIGTGIKESALVKAVGDALMSIVLDKDPNKPLRFREVLTIESLDKIVQAALLVVAEYPSLLANQKGLQNIIAGVAEAFAVSGINRPGLLPELIRVVLLQTAGNLDGLLHTEAGQPKHLLVTALKPILRTLAPRQNDPHWQPKLTNAEIMAIVESVLDEVVKNPSWVTSKVDNNTLLGEVLNATYGALANIPLGQRISGKTVVILIETGLRTASHNGKVLSKIKWGSGDQESTILNHALNLVFAATFKQTSLVEKANLLFELMDYVLDVIIAKHPDANGLLLTQFILQEEANVISDNGFNKETADLLIKAALKSIADHPNLVSDKQAFNNIVVGVANAFKDSGFKGQFLLPELLRVTLENTAGNMELLIPSTVGQPKHLLVVALEEILTALSKPVPDGKWKPTLSNSELLMITETLLDEVVHNPGWITQKVENKPLLSQVLNANLTALQSIPADHRISASVLQMLFELSLHTAAANSKVLGLIKWGSGQVETTILQKALDLILVQFV